MIWLAVGGAVVLVLVIKDARDQRAQALLRDERVRFEAYCDRVAREQEHAL